MVISQDDKPIEDVAPGDGRWRTLKHGDTFAVFDHFGDIQNVNRSAQGLYHKDMRYFSQLNLLIEGQRPLLLSSGVREDALFTVDLANPDIRDGPKVTMPRELLHFMRSKFLWEGACYERLVVHNFDEYPRIVHVDMHFGADFDDLFEVRGVHRARRGKTDVEQKGAAVVFRYHGLDHIERTTCIDFWPAPKRIDYTSASFELPLEPNEETVLFNTIRCDNFPPRSPKGEYSRTLKELRHSLKTALAERFPEVETSNALANRCFARAASDLCMLTTKLPQGPYPYAGIPWYNAPFGRDGLTTALLMLWSDPSIAEGVLKFLAATQASEVNAVTEAEPGKILHEMRQGEMARLGEVPFGHYYGSVDSTPLFVLLAGRYFERTGDQKTIKSLWPNIEAALNWIDTYGDRDKDGFVEYEAVEREGLRNQGWKDSGDSIFHADGTLAEGNIALCEVQGYVFAAKRLAAKMYRSFGAEKKGDELERQANTLRKKFDKEFWCDDLGTYALALDGEKRLCRVRTSNAGRTLFTGIATPAHAKKIVATLFAPESYSGWGIRTVAKCEKRFNPMAYHNGSVWPHDNALIAAGLAQYGFKHEAVRLFQNLLEAAQYMDMMRLPELFCGFERRHDQGPTPYPVACSPQSWSSAVLFSLLESSLGLKVVHKEGEIRFERPLLPAMLGEVQLKNLRYNDAIADILLRRHASEVTARVTARRGDVPVCVLT